MVSISALVQFWISHPALFYGVSSLLGFYVSFYSHPVLLIPCLLFWVPFFCRRSWLKWVGLSLSLFLAVWSYSHISYPSLNLPEKGDMVTAHVSISSLTQQSTPFGQRWIYQCVLKNFTPEGTSYVITSNRSCLISLLQDDQLLRPVANRDYLVYGRLLKRSNQYQLRISKDVAWLPLKSTYSLAEKRFQWKKQVETWIKAQFKEPTSAVFLAGLTTGNFDNQALRQEFARFGLQHIMAISGFHFAIIAGILGLFLRLICSARLSALILLGLMSSYCFFLGSNPSVMRAWIMCSVALLSGILEKPTNSINSLGIALLVVLAFDPLLSLSLAFQFSFLVTAAILIGYGPLDQLLGEVLLKRSLSEMVEMSSLNQHGYVVLAFFRQALALTLAVNLFALPLTLYYFHQFPLMALLYNFFFPFLVSISMGLLLLGALLIFLPPAAQLVHQINNVYTDFILKLTYQLPNSVDHYLSVDQFSLVLLVTWLCASLYGCILLRAYLKREQEELFVFL